MDSNLKKIITECPKAELHYHIDCISPELFWKFSQRNGIELPIKTLRDAIDFYNFQTLDEFLTIMLTAISSIQTENDFSDMVMDCANDMVTQNIIYREVMFDYTACYGHRGVSLNTVINGFAEGLKLAKKRYENIDIRFIANLDRTASVIDNCNYINELIKFREEIPLIAVGMDMQEIGHPAHKQADAFALAKEYGFKLTGHVGEVVGPEGIWDALQSIPLDRIDHGVRAVEDEELLKLLAEKQILLTLCPASNISLGVYSSWWEFPIKKLMNSKVKVCINSDDPPCFHYDLTGNLIKIAETFDLSTSEVIELIRNSFIFNFAGNAHLSNVDAWLDKNIAI
ncbi:adenosine deaminase [Paenibacillus peoriae]|uniref:adenosine deaminase n=1 Tax=Paenibacillus peoriae TaxID=59893 RepID=UPI00096DAB81|nr:adenosine deaminase [Paenibacillus peoriae]OMF45815.1 adenosine deaminase [Paenibacillus peoriae]